MDSTYSVTPAITQQASHTREDAAALQLLKSAEQSKAAQQQDAVKPAAGPGKGGYLDTSA